MTSRTRGATECRAPRARRLALETHPRGSGGTRRTSPAPSVARSLRGRYTGPGVSNAFAYGAETLRFRARGRVVRPSGGRSRGKSRPASYCARPSAHRPSEALKCGAGSSITSCFQGEEVSRTCVSSPG